MVQKTKKIRSRRGMSLVGAMVAAAVISIAIIGTSSLRYHSALDARKANTQTTAARIALILCESWRGINGDLTYDPTAHLGADLAITQIADDGPSKPEDFTLLGMYTVALDYVDSVNYYMTLSWKDVQPGLRALNIVVAWAQRDQGQEGFENVDKTFSLTIYTLTL